MKGNKEKNIVMNQGFVGDIRSIIDKARAMAVGSVDFSRVQMYWNIGKRIFEEEQQGKERADYGTYLIKNLAAKIEHSLLFWWEEYRWILSVKSCSEGITEGTTEGITARAKINNIQNNAIRNL